MLYIGVDLGTSAVKLLMMDASGDIKKVVSREYPLFFPRPGWSEQHPEDWFTQAMDGLKELTAECDRSQVAGISFGGQMHGLVILDENDEVIRPAKRPKKGFHLSDFIERRSLTPALLGGMVFFAYGGILTFIPLYAKSLGLQAETSLFFVVFAFVIILTRPVIGRLFDEKGPDWTVWPGFAFFAAGMVFFSQVTTLVGLLGAAALLFIACSRHIGVKTDAMPLAPVISLALIAALAAGALS